MKKRNLFVVLILYLVTIGFYENILYMTYIDALFTHKRSTRTLWSIANSVSVMLLTLFYVVLVFESTNSEFDFVPLQNVLQLGHLALTTSIAFKIRQALNQEYCRAPSDQFLGRFRTLYLQFIYLQHYINGSASVVFKAEVEKMPVAESNADRKDSHKGQDGHEGQ